MCGDLNVAHTEHDIKNWRGNRGKAGFLAEERAYLNRWYDEHGWTDLGRRFGGDGPGSLHVVVVARPRLRHRRRLADRLRARDPQARRARGQRRGGQGSDVRRALERPRAR